MTWSRAPLDSTELCYCFRAHSKPAPPSANGRRGTGFGFAANRSGRTHHPIVAFTGEREDLAEISDAGVAHAHAYEVAAYVRVKAPLASGLKAWVYVDPRGKPPPA